jgi:hypothetical protein
MTVRFREAVEETPDVEAAYQKGLGALPRAARSKIACEDPRRLTGSIDLDGELRKAEPAAPRWDYGIGYGPRRDERAIWVELHPASSASVSELLKKLEWLRNWLGSRAPRLGAITRGDFHWLATDGPVSISPRSPEAKRLANGGLQGPTRRLVLRSRVAEPGVAPRSPVPGRRPRRRRRRQSR